MYDLWQENLEITVAPSGADKPNDTMFVMPHNQQSRTIHFKKGSILK